MQAFILETLSGTGWRRHSDTIWTLEAASDTAQSLISQRRAKRVRVLPVEVSLAAVAEYPEESEPSYITGFREIAAAESTLPHVREAITAALAAYDARRAVA